MMQEHTVRIAIADDQQLIRAGFSMVINSQPDMHVVAEAADGNQIVQLALEKQPDIILMDVRMPHMDGLQATQRIIAAQCNTQDKPTRIIILTTFDLDEYVMAAIHAGASGFLLKDTEPEMLLNSIRTVYLGNAIIAPTATKRLIETMINSNKRATIAGHPAIADSSNSEMPCKKMLELEEALTSREREVLIEIAHGLSNQEIADKLFISIPTVKTHVAHILTKIHARDRVQAVVFAYQTGLIVL